MGELTAQIGSFEFANRKTWYENEFVALVESCHKLARFCTRLCTWKLEILT